MKEGCEINYKDAVFKIPTSKQKLKQKEYLQNGEIPVIDQGQDVIGGYTNDNDKILECKLPVIVFGDHTKNVKLINFPFAPGADGTKVLQPKKHILPKYLSYITEVLVFKIKDNGYARHYQHIEKEDFPLKSLPEQKAIVKKIEELFSSLDSGIADLKKAQNQLVIYRQAVLKKAFEGELTKEWREKQTNLPFADELLELIKEERQKYYEQQLVDWKNAVKLWEKNGKEGKKPAKPKFIKKLIRLTEEELEKLPKLNKYWHWVKVDKIASHEASSLKAGPFGSSLKKEFYTDSGFKIYGQEQVIANNHKIGNYYINKEKYDSLINCAIKPNDILISLVGTVGKILVLPEGCERGIINPRLVKISLNSFYDSVFFKYYFESTFLKSIYSIKAHGATMDILNLGIIKELPYPLCSIQEQHQIVQEIESRLSVCDKVEKDIADSLEKAQALRQSILKKAFEGKLLSEEEIAKCKADKAYEPASVLLEKIKAEKLVKDTVTKKQKKKIIKKKLPAPQKISTDIQAGVIAKVIQLHENNPEYLAHLTHVKCEKISHLVEYHLQIPLGRVPVKDAAGPDDYNRLKKVEHRARMADYFKVVKKEKGHTYSASRNITKAIDNLESKATEEQKKQLDNLINLFLKFDLKRAEIIATLYAGWNNLLIDGKTPTDDEIVYESRENWSKRKLTIKRERFYNALQWMRKDEINLIPIGFGAKVLKPKKQK